MSSRGVVVTPQPLAADAGAEALRAGGSAVDAAVAAAFALCVVDPTNCGVGGYGGFLVHAPAGGAPVAIDFDTWVPRRFPPSRLRVPGETAPERTVRGPDAVAPPAVVPGLLAAHERFGRRPLAELLAPAIRLARDGFPVGGDLAFWLADHLRKRADDLGNAGVRERFFPGGRGLRAGERLVQADLAETLEAIGRDGAAALRRGRLAEAICAATEGGMDLDDLDRDAAVVRPPETGALGEATVYAPSRELSGAGVLLDALAALDLDRLGERGSRAHVDELARALAHAWRLRLDAAQPAATHTTTLAAADADGGVTALTFTHGPTLGAGILVPGTGIVLNGGANLFAPGPEGPRAVTNMSPVVVELGGGARHAVGATGGPRIPGMLLTAAVDVVHYGSTLAAAVAAPHVSVRAADGRPEVEAPLTELYGPDEATAIARPDFGPMCGVTSDGESLAAAPDPRCECGVAYASW